MYSFQASVREATLTLGVNTPLIHHDLHNNIQETVLDPNLINQHVCCFSWLKCILVWISVHGVCVCVCVEDLTQIEIIIVCDYINVFLFYSFSSSILSRYLVEQKEVELNVRDKWDSTPL